MKRKILIILIILSLFATIAVASYAVLSGALENVKSEVDSEVSEVVQSEATKSETAGVDTEVPSEAVSEVTTPEGNPETDGGVDELGAPRAESTYLDDDRDTVANLYDVCPGIDDFSSSCDTSAYSDTSVNTNTNTSAEGLDPYGVPRAESKYLDEDGDTIANFYDISPGIDDASAACTN
ncbi:hypothetical protein RZE82_01615 [Mollicutes bacterium LVI A0039]|nr:hypothetical protein RZE82_01615 [Mollicutes bacterium LVI A0039]